MNEILNDALMQAIKDAEVRLTLELPDGHKIELFSPDELLNDNVEPGTQIYILTAQGIAFKTAYICIEDDGGEFVVYLSPDDEKIYPMRLSKIKAWGYEQP